MKMILAGAWNHPMYEEACASAFGKLGTNVIPFKWNNIYNNVFYKLENKYSIQGVYLFNINRKLLKLVNDVNPEIILIWLGTSIFPETLKKIKKQANVKIISYVHDDPFSHYYHKLSPKHSKWHWRLYENSLYLYDLNLYSKQTNVTESYLHGSKRSAMCPQYFVPEIHKPIVLTQEEIDYFSCDIVFAGHYEPDERDQFLYKLAVNKYVVRLYADFSWRNINFSNYPDNFKIRPRLNCNEYVKALNGAKICLSFMSKINRDKYTTRCFEIPACKKLLLSERTNELQKIFREDEEAVFFSSKEECLEKVQWLLNNPDEIAKIAEAGYRRVFRNGDDVSSRVTDVLSMISKIQ
jgi:spore maturation protein CgeB